MVEDQKMYMMAGVPSWAAKRNMLEVRAIAAARKAMFGRYQRRRRKMMANPERKAMITEGSLMVKMLRPKREIAALWRSL